jgi:hypothetical protein
MKRFFLSALLIVLIYSSVSAQRTKSSIRKVDFANFTYPYTSDLLRRSDRRSSFRLRDGTFPEAKGSVGMTLSHVAYGDVTGDGTDEALVYLEVYTNGTAIPGCVYIYRMTNAKPKLLWSFDTGDRSDGGLRQAYADHGELVIELYGRGKLVGTDLYADDGTRAQTPYPYAITRTRYHWRTNHFRRVGKPEEFSDSHGYGSPVFAP